jgi:uncharacterized protein YgfB (UPF0149 family)
MPDSQTYEALSDELGAAGVLMAPAELHGGLCGALCAGGDDAAHQWLAQSLGDCGASSAAGRLEARLRALSTEASRALSSFEFGFQPYLPDDDQPLEARVRALASWCQGFLSGLGFGGLGAGRAAPEQGADVEEIMRDFAQISRAELGSDEAEAREQAGFAFAEIAEYVRVGVQVVYEELAERRTSGATAAGRTVH